ncbi:MAG: hypothetical protein J6M55_02445 [Paludibacteraceae bacterium]|nr:hypothetical protein [Paludibacteraceae bacterium]
MAIKKIKIGSNSAIDVQDARLPDVTTSDNGKFLSVQSGAWAKGPTITISSSEPTSSQGSNGDIWIVI